MTKKERINEWMKDINPKTVIVREYPFGKLVIIAETKDYQLVAGSLLDMIGKLYELRDKPEDN